VKKRETTIFQSRGIGFKGRGWHSTPEAYEGK